MPTRRAAPVVALLAAFAAEAATPAPGRYEATLCVANVASAPASCGAVELEVTNPSLVRVRFADIVYRLELGRDRLEVTTMHGAMQIDEFSAAYLWEGEALRFVDAEKDARYEVRVGKRRR